MKQAAAMCAVALLGVTACGGSGSTDSSGGGGPAVSVFAASSLTNAFADVGNAYRNDGGGKATFSFAGSQDLVAQISQGAPADVLATADSKTMAQVSDELAAPAQPFARNQLVIVTAKSNPHHVRTLADLAKPGLVVILADPSVPAGNYAAQALTAAHVQVKAKSLELEARAVLTKVELGEADAGIVYATDAQSTSGKVASIAIADAPIATYEIAPVTDAGKAFVDFAVSQDGQAILERYGFLPP